MILNKIQALSTSMPNYLEVYLKANACTMLKYLCFGVGLFLNVSKPWDAEEIIQAMFYYLWNGAFL